MPYLAKPVKIEEGFFVGRELPDGTVMQVTKVLSYDDAKTWLNGSLAKPDRKRLRIYEIMPVEMKIGVKKLE